MVRHWASDAGGHQAAISTSRGTASQSVAFEVTAVVPNRRFANLSDTRCFVIQDFSGQRSGLANGNRLDRWCIRFGHLRNRRPRRMCCLLAVPRRIPDFISWPALFHACKPGLCRFPLQIRNNTHTQTVLATSNAETICPDATSNSKPSASSL